MSFHKALVKTANFCNDLIVEEHVDKLSRGRKTPQSQSNQSAKAS